MNGAKDILNFLKETSNIKEKLNENKFIKLKDIRISLKDEFERYYSPLNTSLLCIDQLLEINDRQNNFRKRH